jgi:hypothetical protein
MAAKQRPTAEDRREAIRIALHGIAAGVDLPDLARQLEPLHPKNDTFPGEVFLELAADALETGGISREQPVDYEGIRERHLPEPPVPRQNGTSPKPLRATRGHDDPRRRHARPSRRK